MGLFEYHTRYMAKRLSKRTRTSRHLSILFEIVFMIAFIIPSTGSSEPPSTYPPWPFKHIDGQVQNLIAYEKDGSIFLAVDGDVFKYSRQLDLITSTLTSNSTSNVVSNIEKNPLGLSNKILLTVKWNNIDVLLSCWKTLDDKLDCWLNKIDDFGSGLHLLWPNSSKGFRIDSAIKIRALNIVNDSNDLIFASSKSVVSEENSSTNHLPAISRFRISKTPKSLFLDQKAVLTYKSQSRVSLLTFEYLYIFDYNQYTHFILNDHQQSRASSTREAQNQIRLAKICNNDTDLTSYTEISITCNNLNNIQAKHAYFDSTKKDPVLYIVFENLEDPNAPSRIFTQKSHLCSYSMKLIEDLFYNAISECHRGDQHSKLLSKLHSDSDQPPLCQRNPSNDWCSSKLNPYIDGSSYRHQVIEDSYLSLDGLAAVNFIYTTRQGQELKDVVFIGTEYGLLTKMTSDEDLLYTINLNNNQIKNYQLNERFQVSILPNRTLATELSRYAANSNYITAISNNLINQFDTNQCYYYRTCKACLSTRDPLNCDWCGSSCTRKQDCQLERNTDLSCSPIIKDFSPSYGPTTGLTKLRIYGENFGSSRGSLNVKLDQNECVINQDTTSENLIECHTKSIDRPLNASLTVEVLDESGPITSKGVATGLHSFSYVKVQVYGINPNSETKSSAKLVDVFGEHLDVGTSRTVLLGEQVCNITYISRNKLSCLPTRLNGSKFKHEESHPVKVLIDGQEQSITPRTLFDGFNLSISYLFDSDPTPIERESSIVPISDSQDFEGSYKTTFVIITLLMLTTVILFFLFKERLLDFKLKMPSAFELNESKLDSNKVSFRNPQSARFGSSNLNPDGASSVGLVKLNGSVMSSDYFGKQDQTDQDQPLMNNFMDNELLSLLIQEKILIDRNRLTLGHVLGSGQFGRVYKGFLKDQATGEHVAVAVKTLHNRSSWDDALDNRAFVEEGLMMRDFEHENVLGLIGVTFDSNGLPMVVTPFMLYGDLRSYISDEASSPTVKELIDFGTQIARGMAYLSGLKFVHRDLAARNCMLDDNLIVKVADFGLSRDIYERDYYSSDNKKTKLPVKWMAIESLEKCIYNTKTDVWSYGILLWELMTRGVVPYPDVDNFDLFSYLKEGRRMLRPRYCPLILYKIMLSCWDENPFKRPTFDELVQKVSDVITQLKIAKDGQQKVSRDVTYCDVLK